LNNFEVTDFLAGYGAVVGTAALLLNYARYSHAVESKEVKLKIECLKHRRYKEHIEELSKERKDDIYNEHITKVLYEVVIQNIGSVSAYIKEVYIMTSEGEKRQAAEVISNKEIKSKASDVFRFYMSRGSNPFEAKQAYIVDATGRKWSAGCSSAK